jgi:hypothetical protein
MRLNRLALAALLVWPALARADTTVAPSVVTPQASTAYEGVHIVSAVPAAIHGAMVTTGAAAGYFLMINSATDPGNGAVKPLKCVAVAANSTVALSADTDTQWRFSKGIVLVFSTGDCVTETKSATVFFSWQ